MVTDLLSTQLQHLKLRGIKSQTDFDAVLKESSVFRDKNYTNFFSKSFAVWLQLKIFSKIEKTLFIKIGCQLINYLKLPKVAIAQIKHTYFGKK